MLTPQSKGKTTPAQPSPSDDEDVSTGTTNQVNVHFFSSFKSIIA